MDDSAVGSRLDVELEPGAARQFHFRREPQASARFVRLDAPEVEGVPDGRRLPSDGDQEIEGAIWARVMSACFLG